jgi:glucose/arabinose dehydrogenase
VPTIAPSAIRFMPARDENEWASNAFVTGLRSRALFRLQIAEDRVAVEEIFQFKRRLRDVLPISDDRIWLIEDGKSARLLIAKKQD